VILGVLTGGALLAPLAARILGISTIANVRISRYSEDVYTPLGMAKVLLDQARGKHDDKYVLSDPPDANIVRGKRILILDDALASGGTLRAAHRFCVESGAKEVHAVALKVLNGYWSPEPGAQRVPAKKLCLPSFVPWGTF
jgi:adenine/guanine phosphoribosyltransferase-like PRPP-binding protein